MLPQDLLNRDEKENNKGENFYSASKFSKAFKSCSSNFTVFLPVFRLSIFANAADPDWTALSDQGLHSNHTGGLGF